MSNREFHFRWQFDLKSSPERLWPFIADTNRFNRDTGVPKIDVEKDEPPRPNARRKIRLSIYVMPVEWEEQPFEWVKPVRFGIERVYNRGPMARLRVRAELNENPEAAPISPTNCGLCRAICWARSPYRHKSDSLLSHDFAKRFESMTSRRS